MIYLVIYLVIALVFINIMYGVVFTDEHGNVWNDFVEYIIVGLVIDGDSGLPTKYKEDERVVEMYAASRQVMFLMALLWPVGVSMVSVSWIVTSLREKA